MTTTSPRKKTIQVIHKIKLIVENLVRIYISLIGNGGKSENNILSLSAALVMVLINETHELKYEKKT